jgi:hypothetical protein
MSFNASKANVQGKTVQIVGVGLRLFFLKEKAAWQRRKRLLSEITSMDK